MTNIGLANWKCTRICCIPRLYWIVCSSPQTPGAGGVVRREGSSWSWCTAPSWRLPSGRRSCRIPIWSETAQQARFFTLSFANIQRGFCFNLQWARMGWELVRFERLWNQRANFLCSKLDDEKVDLAKVADLAEAEPQSCWVLWRLIGASHLLFDHHHSAHHLRFGHHLTTYTPSWKKKHTDHHDRWMLSWWCDRECSHIQLHYSLFLCTLNTLPPPFLWKKILSK